VVNTSTNRVRGWFQSARRPESGVGLTTARPSKPSVELVADRRIYFLNARSATVSVVSVVFVGAGSVDTFSVGQDFGVVADVTEEIDLCHDHNAIRASRRDRGGGAKSIVSQSNWGNAPLLIALSRPT